MRGGAGNRGACSGRQGPGSQRERELVARRLDGLRHALVVQAVRVGEGATGPARELLDGSLRLAHLTLERAVVEGAEIGVGQRVRAELHPRGRERPGLGLVEQATLLAGHLRMLHAVAARADVERSADAEPLEQRLRSRHPVAEAVVEREHRCRGLAAGRRAAPRQ